MFVKDMRMDDEVLSSRDRLIFFKDDYEYTIRKDDKISISVWGHFDLSVGSTNGIYSLNEVYGK